MKRYLPILISMFLLFVISTSLVMAAKGKVNWTNPPENIEKITLPELPEPIPCTVDDCWLFNNQEQVLTGIGTMQSTLETCNQQRLDALTTLQEMYEAASAEIAALPAEAPLPDAIDGVPVVKILADPICSSPLPVESADSAFGSIGFLNDVYKTDFNNLRDDLEKFCNKPAKVLSRFSDVIENIQNEAKCLGAVTDAERTALQAKLDAGRNSAQLKLEGSQSSYDFLTNELNDFETSFPTAANNSAEICGDDSILRADVTSLKIPLGLPPTLLSQLSASYWSGNLVVKDIGTTGDKLITACPAGTDRTKLTSVVFFDEGKPLYSIGYSEGKVESLSVFSYYEDDPATDQDESSLIDSVQQYDSLGRIINTSTIEYEDESSTIERVQEYDSLGRIINTSTIEYDESGIIDSVQQYEVMGDINTVTKADLNSDGVIDEIDIKLLEESLKSFVDINGDGVVDVCSDTDTDAVIDGVDNCPFIPNPDQSDFDTDGLGDVCDNCPHDPDNDADQDGICGDVDNCPNENPQGLDADSDGCTDTIEGLYDLLQSTEIQAGVKNSLLSKVSSASSSLTRGSVTAAINQLGAFINQVKAQAGKKISWEDTAVLASFAQNIGWTIDPNPPFPDKRPFCPDSPWDKDNPPILTDLYLCQSGCRTDYMNTPDNPAYHRTQTFLACMDDCYRRFGPSCEPEPDATPDSRR